MFFINHVLKFKNKPGHLKVYNTEVKNVPVSDIKDVSLCYAVLLALLSALHALYCLTDMFFFSI
jgi:hypothetical protein